MQHQAGDLGQDEPGIQDQDQDRDLMVKYDGKYGEYFPLPSPPSAE